jgi:hypothetical protein
MGVNLKTDLGVEIDHVIFVRSIDVPMRHRARGWSGSRPGSSPLAGRMLPFESMLFIERPTLRYTHEATMDRAGSR